MSFAYPFVLALLIVPVLLIARVWRREGRRVALPFDHGRQPRGRGWRVLLDLADSLPAVLLAVVILILAGPQRLGEPKSERILTNIEFCVDVSSSMLAPFGEGNRYDTSMKAIDEFLDARKGDAFGLTFFANNVIQWVPLTSDPSALKCAPPFMKPDNAPPWMRGTMIGKALMECKETLSAREEGDRMVVLVTDGESSDLRNGNDAEVAAKLKAQNILVFAIHVGGDQVPDQLATVAGLTGGEVFSAGDPVGLKTIFDRIDAMKQTKLKKTAAETRDDFVPYCIAGLSTLGMLVATLFGLRYTPW